MRRELLVILVVAAVGCGGAPEGGGQAGGVSVTASGPITGFGSFFVAGTAWRVGPSGRVLIDGQSMAENDLELGMVVTVEGERSNDGRTGRADRVVADSETQGPVDSLTPIEGDPLSRADDEVFFEVFGQGVIADRTTSFVNTTFDEFRLNGLGWVVEVSGLPEVDPTFGEVIRATRVKFQAAMATPGSTPIHLEGIVLNSVDGVSFEIRGVTVLIDDAACGATRFEGPIADGVLVEVAGLFLAPTPDETVCANSVDREEGVSDRDDFELEAIVTSVASNASFVLGDIPVDAAGATFKPPALQVAVGMLLEVEGDLQGGTLIARKVKQRADVRLEAVVTSVAADSFVVLGRTIQTNMATKFQPGPPAVTDFVEVSAVDNGQEGLTAVRVEVEPNFEAERVRVRGRVEQIDDVARSLTIAGIPIPTDAATECRQDDSPRITCDTFFATVQIGDLVDARDDLGPFETFDVADRLELED